MAQPISKASIFIASYVALGFTTYSAAEEQVDINKNEFIKCQSVVDVDTRLTCYDKLLPPKTTESESTEKMVDAAKDDTTPVSTGYWQISTESSPIDDSENVSLILLANDSYQNAYGQQVTPALYIRCKENKTETYIYWDTYLGLDETSMLYRLDKQKPKTKVWDISTNSKSVFYRGNVIDYIKTLSKANNMYAGITPYGDSPISATFDLTGLTAALKPLQKACRWK